MTRMTGVLTSAYLLILAVSVCMAGELDDYYLEKFREPVVTAPLHKTLLSASPLIDIPHCGTPLKHGLKRDWDQLLPETRKVLAKQLAAPALSGEAISISPSGRFRIHYATSGTDAATTEYISTVGQVFDSVAASYLISGWVQPPTAGGAPYDIYVRNLAAQSYYGLTTSTTATAAPYANSYASFIEIDNNFTDTVYQNAIGGTASIAQKALMSLQITAAHEFHHAIQYGYNYYFDIWYAESVSTWQEDELYPDVNQLYNYLPAWLSNSTLSLDIAASTSTGGGYGRWLLNRHLAEQYGTGVVKAAWDRLAGLSSSGGADIPMAPVLDGQLSSAAYGSSLGAELTAFAKRAYTGQWTTQPADITRIPAVVQPGSIYYTYPAASSVTLPHYSFRFYKFTPAAAVVDLALTFNKTTGIRTALFKKSGGSISEIPGNPDGSYSVAGFGTMNTLSDEVVLLVVNTTSVDNHQAAFSTSGTPGTTEEPAAVTADGGGGGGSGCFIATAAYGSYLDPHVKVLRDFRDKWLLTSAAGRAFVAAYYRHSPAVAEFISSSESLRLAVRLLLTPIVYLVEHFVVFQAIATLAAIVCLTRRIRRIRQNSA